MPVKIIIQDDLDSSGVEYTTDDVHGTIRHHFQDEFPDTARVYENQVAKANDITPRAHSMEEDIAYMETCEVLYVVVHPGFFLLGLTGLFGSLIKILILGLISFLLRPIPPKERNKGDQSPNNGLSERTNRARPKERIPDIYGEVVSVPDMIMPTWHEFVGNRQVEHAYLCIGRGEFQVSDIKDGVTPIENISAVSVEVYGPNQSPNHTTPQPQQRIGNPINERVWDVRKSNAVTGQTLRAPDATTVTGTADIAFNWPDQIAINRTGDQTALDDFFVTGDTLTVANSTTQGNGINLDGTYEVQHSTASTITLVRPELVNANWGTNGNFNTVFTDAVLSSPNDKWVGPFFLEDPWTIIPNFTAPQGVYKDDGEDQFWHVVEVETEVYEVDENDVQIGTAITQRRFLEGSATLTNERSESGRITPTFANVADSKNRRWAVRCRRITPKGDETDTRFAEQVQWESLFGLGYVDKQDFGDVTTVQIRTPATSGSLAVRERKFNCRVHRRITGRDPALVDPTNPWGFTPIKVSVKDAPLIMRAICLDPCLGAMTEDQLDYQNMFTASAHNRQYFGTDRCVNFNYTFDEKNTSAEEMLQVVGRATFFTPYRQGQQLKLSFERKTSQSSLIFNHRNMLVNSEVRDVRFGTVDDHDGVELDWINPEDGATETYSVPVGVSADNPKKIEILGVSDKVQAHMHAHREWYKLQFKNVATEFQATAEASTLVLNDRIIVADTTRAATVDGQILRQNGRELILSQPFSPSGSLSEYTINIQHYDGTVELLGLTSVDTLHHPTGATEQAVTLNAAPRLPLVLDSEKYANTTYVITETSNNRPIAFLVDEINAGDAENTTIGASNYDDRYYQADEDFKNGYFGSEDTATQFILDEDWESLECPPGEFRAYNNPGVFSSNGAIEVQNNVAGVGPPSQGQKHVELDGNNEIWADLPTDPGCTYQLTFRYSPRAGIDAAQNNIRILWNGAAIADVQDTGIGKTTTDWRTVTYTLTPPAVVGTTRLLFRSTVNGGGGYGGLLDEIQVTETS